MKMLPIWDGKHGWQEDEATERGKQARGDRGGAVRYQGSARKEKESILSEFTQVTDFHRKHAIRVLNREASKVGISRCWVWT